MYEIGKKILFYINKIENNTVHISEVLQQSNYTNIEFSNYNSISNNLDASVACLNSQNAQNLSTTNNLNPFYDSSGAAKYIVIVVLVYGFGIIFFIGSQVRSTKKFSDEVDGVNAEKILRSMETDIFTKEVLEKLSNKEHREKAWKIYLSDSKPENENIKEVNTNNNYLNPNRHLSVIDREAVESIEKKMKTLNRDQNDYINGTDQVEIIKEVVRSKTKQTIASNTSDATNASKQNKKVKKDKKNSKKANPINTSTPMLILQTDIEGLIKLKESKTKKFSSTSNDNISKSNISIITNGQDTESSGSNVSFDLFEISEQITTV